MEICGRNEKLEKKLYIDDCVHTNIVNKRK